MKEGAYFLPERFLSISVGTMTMKRFVRSEAEYIDIAASTSHDVT